MKKTLACWLLGAWAPAAVPLQHLAPVAGPASAGPAPATVWLIGVAVVAYMAARRLH
jgi:hypothetical protein